MADGSWLVAGGWLVVVVVNCLHPAPTVGRGRWPQNKWSAGLFGQAVRQAQGCKV
jgi:hypothetical protein